MKAHEKFLISKWHILLLASIVSIVLGVGGIIYYSYSAGQIRTEKENELKAIAELKISQLVQWYKERTADAKVISLSPLFSNGIEKWLQDKSNKKNEQNIKERLSLVQKEYGYESIILSSTRGDLLLSVGSELERIDDITSVKIIESAKKGMITFTGFYYCDTHDKIHFDIIAPIINESNNKIAVLVFRVDPYDYLYPLIQSWPTLSKTAETLLFRKDGDSVLYLNELRHQTGTALHLRLPLTKENLPAAQAILGKTGIFTGKDYRGIDVIAWLSPVPGTDWFMVSKVDKDEIFAGLYYRGSIIFILIVLLILSLTAGIAWIYHYRQRNIYRSLWQVQEEFRTTLYSIGDAVISTDIKGRIRYMNEVAEKLTGWKESKATGLNSTDVFKIINEETRATVVNPVDKVLKEGKKVGLANHTLLISKDGTETPISDSGAPVKNRDGEILGVVLVFRDQTEERLQQNILKARITLFEFAASHSLNEILTKTLDEVEVLTRSKIGFFHFMLPDQETFHLKAWSTGTEKEFCKADGKGMQYKLSEAGVWTDCIHQKKPVIHNDYASLPDKKGMPGVHAQVVRELVVPVLRNDKIVAVLGAGNKPGEYTDKDVEVVTFMADVAWEIIQKKIKEEEKEESDRKFNSMINNLNGVVYRCANDPDWTMEYLSNSIFSLSGYPSSDFINNSARPFGSIVHDDDKQMIWNEIQKTLEQKSPYTLEYRIITASGEIKWVWERGQGVFDDGKLLALEGYISDITERRQAEEDIKRNREVLQSIFDNIPVMISYYDENGVIQVTNKELVNKLGWTHEEWKTENIMAKCYPEPQDFKEALDFMISKPTGWKDFRTMTKYGAALDTTWTNISLPDGVSIGIGQDITENKKILQDLITAKEQAQESDRLKSAFLSNMSHEIRTPMNGILGFARLLEEPDLTYEEQQDFIQTIQFSGERMLNTINNIVDISRIEAGLMKVEIKESNINEQVGFLYKSFKPEAEQKKLRFSFKTGLLSKEAVINTDIEKVYGILTNLIKNAIKFTDEGSIEFGYEKRGGYLEFYVKDTGPGILSTQKELIFERFRQGSDSFTRNYEGSGLGLAISKTYAEMLGGKLWVESEPDNYREGKGSVFYFTIPYNAVSEEKKAIEIAVPGKGTAAQIKKLKILVAEDDKLSDLFLTRVIRNISSEVLHAVTGVEAVEFCHNNPDIDLVLMDIKMPGMDGYEATRHIRQFNKEVSIIAQTAYGLSGDRERAIEAGCNDYISKPVNIDELQELIQKYFNK